MDVEPDPRTVAPWAIIAIPNDQGADRPTRDMETGAVLIGNGRRWEFETREAAE